MANGNMIVPYVLDPSNLKRLEIAIDVAKSYPQIKQKIVFDFVRGLKSELEKQLPALIKVRNDLEEDGYDFERKKNVEIISLTKPSWKRDDQEIKICLQGQDKGLKGGFMIGVSKSQESNEGWHELLEELQSKYVSSGTSHSWWYYFVKIDQFADWEYDTLIELRKPSTLDFFVKQFESIRAIAEPFIDSDHRAIANPQGRRDRRSLDGL